MNRPGPSVGRGMRAVVGRYDYRACSVDKEKQALKKINSRLIHEISVLNQLTSLASVAQPVTGNGSACQHPSLP